MPHQDDIREFQKKFGQLSYDVPGHLTWRKLKERIECMQEELEEFIAAAAVQDLEEQADALVDLVYFAVGTATMLGLPWEKLWADVHRANMEKEVGIGKRNHLVDCIKPEGWVGPRTTEILIEAGYNKNHKYMEETHRDDPYYISPLDDI